jgi:hypothetical protein
MDIEISYYIGRVEPRNHTAEIWCWTEDTIDDPSWFNLNIPIPAPPAEELKQYILMHCPRFHYERLAVLRTGVDAAPLLALSGVSGGGVFVPPTPPESPFPQHPAQIPVRTV